MHDEPLAELESYKMTFEFLRILGERTGNDFIMGLLSSMSLLEDGLPADSSLREDWQEAIRRVQSGDSNILLRLT